MKKMQVTFTVQIDLDYDEADEETYQERLDLLVEELEEMDFRVDVESEVPISDEDEDEYGF